ncbi:trans-aconitate 2-methyltransferase [Pararhizobium gei]|uniref:trans-aconitate 2-methyltransferase n=1 Tax=Pararhizobium gei TaxID=1395951 RepID=UPI0023DC1684|nr:trans-aconitate 2-methyltransferase [Rhizobium gei]
MSWSAEQYMKFEDERTRPARDLLNQVPNLPEGCVFDLGCGPGNSTELIQDRFPAYRVTGIDSDENMLAAARKRLPHIRFDKGDLTQWRPSEPSVLFFANAVFQWLPDHLAIFTRLMDELVPGGTLAVQMPDNLDEPTHTLMRKLAGEPRFAACYGDRVHRSPLPNTALYIDQLTDKAIKVDVWHTIYYHRLANAEAIVEWVKGTGLRPYLDPLPKTARDAYLAAYLEGIREAYPPLGDGRVLLKFPRLFLIAVKR